MRACVIQISSVLSAHFCWAAEKQGQIFPESTTFSRKPAWIARCRGRPPTSKQSPADSEVRFACCSSSKLCSFLSFGFLTDMWESAESIITGSSVAFVSVCTQSWCSLGSWGWEVEEKMLFPLCPCTAEERTNSAGRVWIISPCTVHLYSVFVPRYCSVVVQMPFLFSNWCHPPCQNSVD